MASKKEELATWKAIWCTALLPNGLSKFSILLAFVGKPSTHVSPLITGFISYIERCISKNTCSPTGSRTSPAGLNLSWRPAKKRPPCWSLACGKAPWAGCNLPSWQFSQPLGDGGKPIWSDRRFLPQSHQPPPPSETPNLPSCRGRDFFSKPDRHGMAITSKPKQMQKGVSRNPILGTLKGSCRLPADLGACGCQVVHSPEPATGHRPSLKP